MVRMSGRGRAILVAAAALGLLHTAFSLYWALGGDWLLATLGERIVSTFGEKRWLLFPVAAVKAVFAVLPVWFASRGGRGGSSRASCAGWAPSSSPSGAGSTPWSATSSSRAPCTRRVGSTGPG